ncbi:MAG TPA: acetyl-CoA acetyltransferase [Burkholderiaceae bacterium]|nr:acetyl-CoA acetyltransferase [Burkholderiaceae bacterium]
MHNAIDPRTPILVGCGDVTDLTTPVEVCRSPHDLIAAAARLALADTGHARQLSAAIDTVAMLRSFADTSYRFASTIGTSTNPPRSVANRLGLNASRHLYTWNGGNMPQALVNTFCEQIASGDMQAALICGGEALRTQHGVQRAGLPASWAEDPGGTPELIGDPRRGWSDHEERHRLRAAITFYPLFENAIRGARGASVEQHLRSMGELLARFAAVAVANPLATRRDGMSGEQLATVDTDNRWIGFPYPRYMNANAFIDQAAALVLTSVGVAQRVGIARDKWVFVHGCADGNDHWFVSERADFHSSPAICAVARQALAMAGQRLDDIALFDLYSCFASAVEVACAEVGLAEDDPRGLTITGGLPFFGGPGNNYVTHAIAEMMRRLRAAPGRFGVVSANGNYLTKHSWGVYSTTPITGRWQRETPSRLQSELDRGPHAPFSQAPNGRATIETYTVMHDREGPTYAVLFGRLLASGERFIANTPDDAATLHDLQQREGLGRPGTVSHRDGHNTFVPD